MFLKIIFYDYLKLLVCVYSSLKYLGILKPTSWLRRLEQWGWESQCADHSVIAGLDLSVIPVYRL